MFIKMLLVVKVDVGVPVDIVSDVNVSSTKNGIVMLL